MADLATLQVKIDAAQAITNARGLTTELDKMGRTGKVVEDELKKVQAEARKAGGSFGELYRILAVGAVAQTARQMVDLVDTAKLLDGRLKLVTKSSAELAAVQGALRAQAAATRSSYESTVILYSRTAQAASQLGISQQNLLKFTELTNMAVKASGATSAEAAGALVQLSQGIASGTLRGQELMSVMEQLPAVAQAIQAGLGITQGEFRKLAAEGKITGREVIEAINRMEQKIRKDFATAPQTVSEAFVRMKDEIMFALADVDKATNSSSNIVKNVERLTRLVTGALTLLRQMPLTPFGQIESAMAMVTPRRGGPISAQGISGITGRSSLPPELAAYMNLVQGQAGIPQKPSEEAIKAGKKFAEEMKKALEAFEEDYRKATEEAFVNRVDQIERQAQEEEEWVRKVNGRILQAWRDAEEEAAKLRAEAADRELAKQIERDAKATMKVIEKDMERIKLNEELAENFRENMQRALGDFFTEFVTKGKVSMREMFDAIKQTGGQMAGQGISSVITGMLPKSMGPFGSILAGLGLVGLGGLFGSRDRTPRMSAEEKIAQAQNRYASIELLRQQRADEMRKFVEGRNGGRGGVIQSVGTVLQETTASRMIGELVAIRVATTRTADAVAGSSSMSGAQVNVTVQGGMGGDLKQVGADVAAAVDRLLGTRVQALRLTSGAAVTT